MRLPLATLAVLGSLTSALHAQGLNPDHGANKTTSHCQQPVKDAAGKPVTDGHGKQVTEDCPQQGKTTHPAVMEDHQRRN